MSDSSAVSTTSMRVGEAIVAWLEDAGVSCVFGIPGVHTLELYRGLPKSSIRHVLSRHEQGAAFMADGYARVTGRPGVCFLITGPGVTNAATAIGQAYADSVPLLIISSTNSRSTLGQGDGQLHECRDPRALTAGITALSELAICASDIPRFLRRAFALFATQRPRPVHLSIPIDLLAEPLPFSWQPLALPSLRPPTAARELVVEASRALAQAKRPAIVVGGGALGAGAEIEQLACSLSAPVFTSVAAKGLLPSNHPLHAGATLCTATGQRALAQADVVFAIGTELSETDHWRTDLPLPDQLIRLDIDPLQASSRWPASIHLMGDARTTLQDLLQGLQRFSKAGQPWLNVAALNNELRASLTQLERVHGAVLNALQRCATGIAAGVRFSSDMTQLAYSGNFLLNPEHPKQWLHPTGYGTLGYGLPAAVGAAIADPHTPVLAIVGDGGLLYTIAELMTAVDEVHGSLTLLVWNNEALGQIRDDMINLGIQPIAVTPRAPDFVMLAQSMGCSTQRISHLADLEPAICNALSSPGVKLLDVNAHSIASSLYQGSSR